MSSLKIDLTNCTDDFIAAQLRKQLHIYSRNPLRSARWWYGFACGLILMASMNIGDVHFCVGECDASGAKMSEIFKGGTP